jgi:hypothetical protein
LDETNANYRGLRSRRFRIKRKGSGLSTKYSIAPEDVDSGSQKMTDKEKKLESDKYDLREFTKSPSYDEFLKELGEVPEQNQNGSGDQTPKNPFMRKS